MATVKAVMIMRAGEGYGWQEVHYRDSGSDTPNLQAQLDTLQNEIAIRRAPLLGADCSVVGLRVSYPRDGVVASQSRKVYLPGEPTENTTSQSNSLAMPWFDTTRTRHKTTHLRGFWDSVESNEAYHPEGGAAHGWASKLGQYTAALVARTYGWPSKDAALSSKGRVADYIVTAAGVIRFTIIKDGGADLVAGKNVTVRFSRINHSKSVLNDSFLCYVVDPTHVETVNEIAAGPFITAGRFNVRVPAFTAYSGCEVPSLGERRMGAPLGHYPGRRKARQRV